MASPNPTEIEQALLSRWPENRVAPDLRRIEVLVELLGDPHLAAPVIHIAGTNGKTSTARMIDELLRSFGLSVGLFTSPALLHMRERIQVNGEPVPGERFAEVYQDIAPYLDLADAASAGAGGPRVTTFEALTAMAFACFADTPVDVMVIECGMGGSWDATNVVRPEVSVITPIGIDHTGYLGSTLAQIASEKAGILKAGAGAVLAGQEPEAAEVLLARCAELAIAPVREGVEFGVMDRALAVGGQSITLAGLGGQYDEIFLPLHGFHQASNAALALAAVESFLGSGAGLLDPRAVRAGFAAASSPGRLEVVRGSPTVVVDAAHNPHGAAAAAEAMTESFGFQRVIGVLAVLADKDCRGLLEALEPVLDDVVVTSNSSPRALPAGELSDLCAAVFGEERVRAVDSLAGALELAFTLADESAELAGPGTTGILATGSVVTAGDVRALLVEGERE